jgi:predicted nucleic acid-binding protein
MKIVFNSSPLIFLSRLNFLDLFLTNEAQFLLPESVQKEISAKQDQPSVHINTLITENKLLVQKVQLISLTNHLNERLGIGESQAIEDVYESEENIYKSAISIDELHEFLLVEEKEKQSEIYELRKVYA